MKWITWRRRHRTVLLLSRPSRSRAFLRPSPTQRSPSNTGRFNLAELGVRVGLERVSKKGSSQSSYMGPGSLRNPVFGATYTYTHYRKSVTSYQFLV
ncbi:hypothetical protein B0H66DRAFT_396432 [Apodospora peruviana]|uniref:Uncharacterized protein n=1 Tax=Apodospora peruviana TaxID=516989 RepID=A0AAE0HUN4_9PEZI|nr:hypothetical protein B0H66DRAFT_396432 [Apodospora peruviana]